MRLTLGDACNLLNEYVEYGMCATDPRVIRGINMAIERLLPALNPEKSIARYQIDVYNGTITCPRDVKTVLAASTSYPACTGSHCGPGCRTIFSVKSRWYEMLPGGPVDFLKCTYGILMDIGSGFSTFADPTTDNPLTIRVYADVPQAASEGNLVIRALDGDGNNIISYDNNTYVPGILLPIPIQGQNFIDSDQTVSQIISVSKPQTVSRIRLYGVDPVTGVQTPLAIYDPDEINPDYRRYMVSWVGDNAPGIITVLAKRRYIRLQSPYADLFITNTGALQNALMAMKYERAGAFDQAAAAWKTAFGILDQETRDFDGDYKATVGMQDDWGGGGIWNMR
jgi:hypothetical protein